MRVHPFEPFFHQRIPQILWNRVSLLETPLYISAKFFKKWFLATRSCLNWFCLCTKFSLVSNVLLMTMYIIDSINSIYSYTYGLL